MFTLYQIKPYVYVCNYIMFILYRRVSTDHLYLGLGFSSLPRLRNLHWIMSVRALSLLCQTNQETSLCPVVLNKYKTHSFHVQRAKCPFVVVCCMTIDNLRCHVKINCFDSDTNHLESIFRLHVFLVLFIQIKML